VGLRRAVPGRADHVRPAVPPADGRARRACHAGCGGGCRLGPHARQRTQRRKKS
jgi:hypothetical protein